MGKYTQQKKELMKSKYEERKAKGVCVKCGVNKPDIGYVMCEKCKEKVKEYSKAYQNRNRNRENCFVCGKPSFGKYYCPECKAKYAQSKKEERMFYISRGICPICRQEDAFGGRQTCYKCWEKLSDSAKDNYEKYKDKALPKLYAKRKIRTQYRKENSLCVRCGKKVDDLRFSNCSTCRIRERNRQANKKGSIPRNMRVELGFCYICGDKREDGKRLCARCIQNATRNVKGTCDNTNHVWRKDDHQRLARFEYAR